MNGKDLSRKAGTVEGLGLGERHPAFGVAVRCGDEAVIHHRYRVSLPSG